MKLKTLLIFLSLFMVTLLWADPVSQNVAREKAIRFVSKYGKTIARNAKNMYYASGKAQVKKMPYYVFNTSDNNGFVIVSGDDRTAEILAYSEESNFDAGDIPENMSAWLSYYADVIGSLEKNTPVKAKSIYYDTPMNSYGAIAPLLSCTWNQGSPYYDRCPLVEGRRCYTGCVCTAAVQVMYFHKWPQAASTNIPAHSFTYNNIRYTPVGGINLS